MKPSTSLAVLATAAVAIGISVAVAASPDGSKVTLSIGDVAAAESNSGTSTFVFTVSASGSLKGTAKVSFATANGTAVAPGDYAASSGSSLSFDRHNKTGTVTVQVFGETADEQDEMFQVQLSGASGATITDGTGVGTILDDDSPPVAGPKIAAAGDIACDPASGSYNGGQGTATECKQRATSELLVAGNYAAVLALGDNQYENAAFDLYTASYDPSWVA